MDYKHFLLILAAVAMSALLGACEITEVNPDSSSDADVDGDTDGDTDTESSEPRDFFGSCFDSPSMTAGECMEFVGETYVDTDNPVASAENVCDLVSGTFSATERCTTTDLVGICRNLNQPADTDLSDTEFDNFYYAPNFDAATAEAKCTCDTCVWVPV